MKKNHSFHTKIQGNAIPRSGEEEEKLAMDKNLTSWQQGFRQENKSSDRYRREERRWGIVMRNSTLPDIPL